ncbi:hypothetical protein KM176_14625 [Pseudooceanicola sp. CBS1P-1]|uniref:Uncharacterized protein n=1 Tax=Pseudooceanicola albus TaxID=2692189 RepID=A0A6L7G5C1_9RHOB|nr:MULTISPECIES: hypothetical protein [Pseudooceanicola]MBT9385102.1 hypothetical protein [Pseudooceanicola endophyticus]MXN18606.1 hypothetical protein [Pseudooceanicola albus]
MAQKNEANCTLDREAGTFTLALGTWENTYPVADLDRWLAFYRSQREHFPKSLDTYDRTIALLEQAQARLQG